MLFNDVIVYLVVIVLVPVVVVIGGDFGLVPVETTLVQRGMVVLGGVGVYRPPNRLRRRPALGRGCHLVLCVTIQMKSVVRARTLILIRVIVSRSRNK